MQYIGEQLIWGQIGNLLIGLAFVGALLGSISYFLSFKKPDEEKSWKQIARASFLIHGLSVIGIFGVLYYLIFNHRFEYYYVWQHSSLELPMRYIFSCFWEGQEGSFLLWTFWHVVLGLILVFRAGKWEGPVMVTVCLVQVFLMSMVLGVFVLGHKIGTNPFTLLREHPDMANLPFVQFPDYLQRIEDGRGLNPLLQNYWMVIHPPVLFLGFASTLIPFAYAMGGMMSGRIREWTAQATPWAFFGVMILGTGILMGGAWAYEALSFGGFWAWDPVENASLVPWMTFVGAAHVMVIHKKNGTTLLSSFLLTVVTFILILYSTFLTRSGILGDTSVHSFTDLGMTGQLVVYMAFFALMALWLWFRNRKAFVSQEKDDHIYSREFWMFIGMLVMFIAGLQITFTTSIPVINKIFGTNMAPPADVIDHYNSWQIPFAIIICLIFGYAQFLKYKSTQAGDFWKKIIWPLVASIAISAVACYHIEFDRIQYIILFFAAMFAFIANMDYSLRFLKGKFDHTGGSVTHIGMALILLGALVSNGKQEVISKNMLNVDLGKDFPNNENIMLFQGDTLQMSKYFISYTGKEREGVNVYYNVEYFTADFEEGKLQPAFTLRPRIQLNPRMGNVAEPSTRRFFDRDIYTHITYADMESLEKPEAAGDYLEAKLDTMQAGDTITTSNSLITFKGLSQDVDRASLGLSETDVAVAASLEIIDVNNKKREAKPLFVIRGQSIVSKETIVDDLGLKISFNSIDPNNGNVIISVAEKKDNKREFIIMKAIVFPYINVLWTGCILLIIGSMMAVRKRFRDLSRSKSQES
ncbi:MAG: cytochrome c biogenesis protein CcsA [Bacteroidota bacterium]